MDIKEYKLYTERLILELATNEEMEKMIHDETNQELKAAYSEMYEGCKRSPNQPEWNAIWFMKLKDQPDQSIGDMAFKGLSEDGVIEIGYGIHPEYEGQGYTTEAVTSLVKWASSRPLVKTIEAEADPDNIASQKVLEKSGFVPNGKMGEEGPRYLWKG